jgi:exopolyphosphatase / guanosine-5'-triphosphate,3'-diphosphate pyrophosphatase
MRLGVLDIGSNSAQLQVVEVYPGAPPLPTHSFKEPTLLAEAADADGSIAAAGVQRVTVAVARAMAAADALAVGELYAFVTASVRDAANRDEVLEHIEREAGVRPQFLSGEDEARLVYHAAHRWYGWSAGRLLVLDIGGGSMEIVLGRDAEPDLCVSLPLGAGRMTRTFLPDDPPGRRQLRTLRRHVRDTVHEVADRLCWEGAPRTAVATSKTFKQLARLAGAPPQRHGPFVPRTLTAADLDRLVPRLAALTAAQRAALRGVSAPRARQILAGAVVARTVLRALRLSRVDICPWALREGVILRHLAAELDRTAALPLRPVPLQRRGSLATVTSLPAKG